MKKTVFTLGLLSFALLSMAQSMNDSIAKEKMTLFQKHHKKIFSTINRTTTLRSVQTTNIQLDSVVNVNSKETDKEVFTYNSNGQISISIQSYFDDIKWVNGEKDLYTYDSNNRLSLYFDQSWDETSLAWVDDYKEIITYNAAGKVSLETGYSWDSSSSTWTPGSTKSYTYNINNQLIADTTTSGSGSSTFKVRIDYTYDVNNNLSTKIEYHWDNTNLEWNAFYKSEFTYTNNKLTSSITYYWNSTWTNQFKESFSYDANGNLTEDISQNWNGIAWGLRDKTLYNYNSSYLLSNLFIPDDYKTISFKVIDLDLSYNNMMTSYVRYQETATDVWSQYTEETYYFNNQANAVFNAKASNLKITTENGKAVISGLSQGTPLAVYNLQGTAIYNQPATSETVSINLPARGVYVVKVGAESVKVVY